MKLETFERIGTFVKIFSIIFFWGSVLYALLIFSPKSFIILLVGLIPYLFVNNYLVHGILYEKYEIDDKKRERYATSKKDR